jgi:hypothetical protein
MYILARQIQHVVLSLSAHNRIAPGLTLKQTTEYAAQDWGRRDVFPQRGMGNTLNRGCKRRVNRLLYLLEYMVVQGKNV